MNDTLALVPAEQKAEVIALRQTLAAAAQRIDELTHELITKTATEKRNADRLDVLEGRFSDALFSFAPVLRQVREALYGKRTLIEESMDRINNTLSRYADLPTRAEFQALLERVDGLAARETI